jgi:putative ABC transport system permease protein
MVKMQRVDIGFDTSGLISARIQLPLERYKTEAARRVAFDQIMERARVIPGVTEATYAIGVPPRTGVSFGKLEIQDRALKPGEQVSLVTSQFPMPDYFKVMRHPFVAGRTFARDTSAREVIINETMAKTYWPAGSAVGRQVRMDAKGEWRTVVGVVRDVTIPSTGLKKGSGTRMQMYFPNALSFESTTLIMRTAGTTPDLARRLLRETAVIDPSIRVRDVATVESLMTKQLAGPRFNMSLLAAFAGLALVLASIGLYGVIAYSVSQRTREMGIRLALGADQPSVLRLVMSQGARLTLFGLVVGLAGAAALTRVMVGMLYGVTPLDPITFSVVGMLLAGVAAGASYFPARRATRVDPVVALRAE